MIALPELLELLNTKYLNRYHTIIVGGFCEPFYKASVNGSNSEIQFSHDYIRSALHELSHWCVAGPVRRTTDDYGYWYAEDGRTQLEQDAFYKVEVKPQAIEWAFSIVCGVKFEASVDNLHNSVEGIDDFRSDLYKQLICYLKMGFSHRVTEIIQTLATHLKIAKPIEFIQNQIQYKIF